MSISVSITAVEGNRTDSKSFLEASKRKFSRKNDFSGGITKIIVLVCSKYDEMLSKKQPPHVILDTTITGVGSETVKSFSVALGIPTITASFGQEGDLRQWRNLNDQKRNYLLQVSKI